MTETEAPLPGDCVAVAAPAGSVWKILIEPGATVGPGQVVIVIETMKMEMEITAPVAGRVHEILCQIGRVVQAGQRLAVLQSYDCPRAEQTEADVDCPVRGSIPWYARTRKCHKHRL